MNNHLADALEYLCSQETISKSPSPWEPVVLPLNYARMRLMLAAGLARA
jgi:hypothetical protein